MHVKQYKNKPENAFRPSLTKLLEHRRQANSLQATFDEPKCKAQINFNDIGTPS